MKDTNFYMCSILQNLMQQQIEKALDRTGAWLWSEQKDPRKIRAVLALIVIVFAIMLIPSRPSFDVPEHFNMSFLKAEDTPEHCVPFNYDEVERALVGVVKQVGRCGLNIHCANMLRGNSNTKSFMYFMANGITKHDSSSWLSFNSYMFGRKECMTAFRDDKDIYIVFNPVWVSGDTTGTWSCGSNITVTEKNFTTGESVSKERPNCITFTGITYSMTNNVVTKARYTVSGKKRELLAASIARSILVLQGKETM